MDDVNSQQTSQGLPATHYQRLCNPLPLQQIGLNGLLATVYFLAVGLDQDPMGWLLPTIAFLIQDISLSIYSL